MNTPGVVITPRAVLLLALPFLIVGAVWTPVASRGTSTATSP